MLAVRREVLEEFLRENEDKIRKCKNFKELAKLLYEWAREKGLRVVAVDG